MSGMQWPNEVRLKLHNLANLLKYFSMAPKSWREEFNSTASENLYRAQERCHKKTDRIRMRREVQKLVHWKVKVRERERPICQILSLSQNLASLRYIELKIMKVNDSLIWKRLQNEEYLRGPRNPTKIILASLFLLSLPSPGQLCKPRHYHLGVCCYGLIRAIKDINMGINAHKI